MDNTNWKSWYWGLIIFLALQIVVYYSITKFYQV